MKRGKKRGEPVQGCHGTEDPPRPPAERRGTWHGIDPHGGNDGLPAAVAAAMAVEYPDWDWTMFAAGGHMWMVARIFEGGRETERIAARVVRSEGK